MSSSADSRNSTCNNLIFFKMSNKIQEIQDKTGNTIFPLTHERAVRDSSGVNLETKLQDLQSTGVQLEGEISQLSQEVGDLTHSDFTLYPGWMRSNEGAYAAHANTYFSVIPVRAGASYKITKNPSSNAHVAFLNSFSGVPTGGSFDINGTRIIVTSSTPVTGIVPTGANYIYLLRVYGGTTWQMPTIEIDGVDITKDLGTEILSLAQRQAGSEAEIAGKQATLISGNNIKTINGESVLGEGNLQIQSGGDAEVDINLQMTIDGKFNGLVFTDGAFLHKTNGNPSSHSSYKYTADYYKIRPGEYNAGLSSSGNACSMCFYDKDKVYLNEYAQGAILTEYTVPQNAIYVRFSTISSVVDNHIQSIDKPNLESLDTKVTSLENSQDRDVVPAIRLYPNTKLPVISFTFDDCVDNDALVVPLFEAKGLRCGFAFIASDAKMASKAEEFKGYQMRGHSILSHSVDATIFNTDNYTQETARAALYNSIRKLENYGFVVNGFVAPSSQLNPSFIGAVRDNYSYAFTYTADGHLNDRQANPCNLIRKSMEALTTAQLKAQVDSSISGDGCLIFYGHTANFGTINPTSQEEWNITKLGEIIDYCIAKWAAGLCWLGSPDEAMKYYYDL